MSNICRNGCRKKASVVMTATVLEKCCRTTWKLAPSENSNAYTQYRLGRDGSIYEYNYKGRYYKLSKNEILNLYYSDDFDDKSVSA